jgi:choline dehydrogenase
MLDIPDDWQTPETPLDFIIVGGGAAGCPLAARLAERGYKVLVLEMGPAKPPPAENSAVENTEVPLLHPETTEDPRHQLNYFVNQRGETPTHATDETGVYYPRAQGLGGCSIHNAMITICGPSEDWDEIAELTGDMSWRAQNMRTYFQRVERCLYARPESLWEKLKAKFGNNLWESSRHGQTGWLTTSMADLSFLKRDKSMLRVVLSAASTSLHAGMDNVGGWLRSFASARTRPSLDPNHWETMQSRRVGIVQIPCAIDERGRRSSPRDRLRLAQSEFKERLMIRSGVLVTQIQFEGKRAVGVDILPKAHAYQADPNADKVAAIDRELIKTIRCRNEVILCAGTFSSPQLLMLSGIGDPELLKQIPAGPFDNEQSPGIPVLHPLPGVGRNLQDRYEVPVISTLKKPFGSLAGVGLSSKLPAAEHDQQLKQWQAFGAAAGFANAGIYSSNGGLIGILRRSKQENEVPDLFVMALAGKFAGYKPGWSSPEELIPETSDNPGSGSRQHRTVSWLLLKARTRNRSGYVRLRSKDPTRRPEINFRNFETSEENRLDAVSDLDAMAEGVEFIQEILKPGLADGSISNVELPGLKPDQEIKDWIRETAWGHHASGTCCMGPADQGNAVVDSRFRVHGLSGLRVVDASIFPRIPGYFIASSVYMIAEKAADVLSEEYPMSKCGHEQLKSSAPILRSLPETINRTCFPAELEAAEAKLIRQRRKAAGL